MIIKYDTYIKENYEKETDNFFIDVLIMLEYINSSDKYDCIKIQTNRARNNDIIKVNFHNKLLFTVKDYDSDAYDDTSYIVFKLQNKLEYNYLIFYYTYIKEYQLKHPIIDTYTFVYYKKIKINLTTTKKFINTLNKVLKVIREKRFENIIDKYILTNNKMDQFILNCLTEEQKIKYDYLIQAKNFDLI